MSTKAEEQKRFEVSLENLEQILSKYKDMIVPEDFEILENASKNIVGLALAYKKSNNKLHALARMVFGPKTEQKKNRGIKNKSVKNGGKKGRNGNDSYPDSETVPVPHSELNHGDPCPACGNGRVYLINPSVKVTIHAVNPFRTTRYEMDRLRCNMCNKIFKAETPTEAKEKYDSSTLSMLALLRYGNGMPSNRIEDLLSCFGFPFSGSTQSMLATDYGKKLEIIVDHLSRIGANTPLIHLDDTGVKILSFMQENKAGTAKRKGMHTTGIVCVSGQFKIALYITGRNHSGENIKALLEKRSKPPEELLIMCDALPANTSLLTGILVAYCLVHARRYFVNMEKDFPRESKYVLDLLGLVYKHDQESESMTPRQRLCYHRKHSKPVMKKLNHWLRETSKKPEAEPNSLLGKAIAYTLNNWQRLTLFLRKEGAPLDNNICERSIKIPIRHRKNSLFYKTENGAHIGDIFMSLIQTCKLNNINPHHYLTSLGKHISEAEDKPHKWMPWNYEMQLAKS